jgi:hypothetical protein
VSLLCLLAYCADVLTFALFRVTVGPFGYVPDSVVFGPSPSYSKFASFACSVTVAQTTVTCSVPPGYGASHGWLITVGGQTSAVSGTVTAVFCFLARFADRFRCPCS